MILNRLGPCRLSPSLTVWQVRQALLNTCCPAEASAPCGAWAEAGGDSSTHANPLAAMARIEVCMRRPPLFPFEQTREAPKGSFAILEGAPHQACPAPA